MQFVLRARGKVNSPQRSRLGYQSPLQSSDRVIMPVMEKEMFVNALNRFNEADIHQFKIDFHKLMWPNCLFC